MEEAAKLLRLEIHPFPVTDPGQFASAFLAMIEKRMEAVEVVAGISRQGATAYLRGRSAIIA